MALPALPSREDFLANDLRVVDACGICLEPFDVNHVPVVFGNRESCRHIFGNNCLQQWLRSTTENSNKCPTCRHTLFRYSTPTHYQGEPYIDEDYDESEEYNESDSELNPVELEMIRDRDVAPEGLLEEDKPLAASASEFDVPARLQDITDRALACDFAVHLAEKLKAGVWFSNAQLLRCLEETCHVFVVPYDVGCLDGCRHNAMISLLHDLFREDVVAI